MPVKIETPRGTDIKSDKGNVRLVWNPDFVSRWEEAFDEVQKYIDSEVLRLTSPYLPKQSGLLEKLGMLGTEVGSGEVVYNGPYARYLYYGKLMVGRAPKRLTDIDLNFHGAPKRGGFWFERMKADKKEQILKGAAKVSQKESHT